MGLSLSRITVTVDFGGCDFLTFVTVGIDGAVGGEFSRFDTSSVLVFGLIFMPVISLMSRAGISKSSSVGISSISGRAWLVKTAVENL